MTGEEQLLADIKSLKIQGATNVALALLGALAKNPDKALGMKLAYARQTEPLAQNAVRFVFSGQNVQKRITTYKKLIADAKTKITTYGAGIIENNKTYVTHCHASTVTGALIAAHEAQKHVSVITTETRPRYQGRITAQELLDAGIKNVTMIVDSAAASVFATLDISAVLVGADVLCRDGFVNKIGTLGMVTLARAKNIPVYCFATLLKYDPTPVSRDRIEQRDPKEVWPSAPKTLTISNAAFDVIPYSLGISVVTQNGIIKGEDIWQTPTPTT